MQRAVVCLTLLLTGGGAVEIEDVTTKAQLRAILVNEVPHLVLFHDGSEPLTLPQGEADRRPTAWFAKTAAVWDQVLENKVPWLFDGPKLGFAQVDVSKLSQAPEDDYDSEVDMMLGHAGTSIRIRLFYHGQDLGTTPFPESRRDMHVVMQWAAETLRQKKYEL